MCNYTQERAWCSPRHAGTLRTDKLLLCSLMSPFQVKHPEHKSRNASRASRPPLRSFLRHVTPPQATRSTGPLPPHLLPHDLPSTLTEHGIHTEVGRAGCSYSRENLEFQVSFLAKYITLEVRNILYDIGIYTVRRDYR